MAKRKPGKRPNIISAPRPPAAMRSREGFIRWEWSHWIGTPKIKQSVARKWLETSRTNQKIDGNLETVIHQFTLFEGHEKLPATVDTSEIQQTPVLEVQRPGFYRPFFSRQLRKHPKIEDYVLLLVGLTSATIDELGYPSDQRISESTTGPSSHGISTDFPMLHEEFQSPWSYAVVNLRIFHWKLHPDATTNMRLWRNTLNP